MNRDINEVALTMVLFDKDNKRRKMVLDYLEQFCRSIYSTFYAKEKGGVTETSFKGKEMEVIIKFDLKNGGKDAK